VNKFVVANNGIVLGEDSERGRLDHGTTDILAGETANGGQGVPLRYHDEFGTTLVRPLEKSAPAISFDFLE
jgi:hypothetical protein